jgi:hypothetical protein
MGLFVTEPKRKKKTKERLLITNLQLAGLHVNWKFAGALICIG